MLTIVTDSSVYMKKEEAEQLNVKIVPLNYTVNGKLYYESYSDHNGEFEEQLREGAALSTSQPNVSAFLNRFEKELSKGNEILCITLSSRLSGTYQTAQMAANQVKNGNITVFDGLSAAGGLYLLIKEARKLAQNGGTLNEIANNLPEIRERIKLAFAVDDITPLRNSGRIANVRMRVGTILNHKPIFRIEEGAIIFDSTARGKADVIRKALNMANPNAGEFVVNYIGYSQLVTNLYNMLTDTYPDKLVSIRKAGPVMGIILGLEAASLSFISS